MKPGTTPALHRTTHRDSVVLVEHLTSLKRYETLYGAGSETGESSTTESKIDETTHEEARELCEKLGLSDPEADARKSGIINLARKLLELRTATPVDSISSTTTPAHSKSPSTTTSDDEDEDEAKAADETTLKLDAFYNVTNKYHLDADKTSFLIQMLMNDNAFGFEFDPEEIAPVVFPEDFNEKVRAKENGAMEKLHKDMSLAEFVYHILSHTVEMRGDNRAALDLIALPSGPINDDNSKDLLGMIATLHDLIQARGGVWNEYFSYKSATEETLELPKEIKQTVFKCIMATTMHFDFKLKPPQVLPLSLIFLEMKKSMAQANGEVFALSQSDIMMLMMTYFDINRASFIPTQREAHTKDMLKDKGYSSAALSKILSDLEINDDHTEAALIGLGQSLRMIPELMGKTDSERKLLSDYIKAARCESDFTIEGENLTRVLILLSSKLKGEAFFASTQARTLALYEEYFKMIALKDGGNFANLVDFDYFKRQAKVLTKLKTKIDTYLLALEESKRCCAGGFWKRNKTSSIAEQTKEMQELAKVLLLSAGNSAGVNAIKENSMDGIDLSGTVQRDYGLTAHRPRAAAGAGRS